MVTWTVGKLKQRKQTKKNNLKVDESETNWTQSWQFKFNSIQIYLYSTFHIKYCFIEALQKVHFRNVHGKIHLVNHVII